jgi:hypothetical protein
MRGTLKRVVDARRCCARPGRTSPSRIRLDGERAPRVSPSQRLGIFATPCLGCGALHRRSRLGCRSRRSRHGTPVMALLMGRWGLPGGSCPWGHHSTVRACETSAWRIAVASGHEALLRRSSRAGRAATTRWPALFRATTPRRRAGRSGASSLLHLTGQTRPIQASTEQRRSVPASAQCRVEALSTPVLYMGRAARGVPSDVWRGSDELLGVYVVPACARCGMHPQPSRNATRDSQWSEHVRLEFYKRRAR